MPNMPEPPEPPAAFLPGTRTRWQRGTRYLLTYKLPLQKLPRTAVLDYLGDRPGLAAYGAKDPAKWQLSFDGRPLCGTQDFEYGWLTAAVAVPPSTPKHINRIVRPS